MEESLSIKEKVVLHWKPPEIGRLKCNIGFSWSQSKAISGASWVLCDNSGSIICHSRRSYSNVSSCFDAKVNSWEWALQSKKDMQKQDVMFEASSLDIIEALHQPLQWPAFMGHTAGLLKMTIGQYGWDISFEDRKCNFGSL